MATATVTLFKGSGKYYTEEQWEIPEGALGPYAMSESKDARLIGDDGYAVVPSQEPWGYPHLIAPGSIKGRASDDASAEPDEVAVERPWESHEDPRMNAYYYGFKATGVPEIDWVLHAVAVAGKGLHNTDQWRDEDHESYIESHGLRGTSFEKAMQHAAEDAAASLRNRPGDN